MRFLTTLALLSLAAAAAIPAKGSCGSISTFMEITCQAFECGVGTKFVLRCSGNGTSCANSAVSYGCGGHQCIPSSGSCTAASTREGSGGAARRLDESGAPRDLSNVGPTCASSPAALQDWLERPRSTSH